MKKEFTHDEKGEETMHFLHQVDEDDNDQCKQNRLGAGTAFGLPLHSFHFQKIKKIVFLKVGGYMKTSFAWSFFAVDTMSMSASSNKRKSTR